MATTDYLDQLLDPLTDAFTADVARRVADIRADEHLQRELDRLRRKANEGALSPAEDNAYKDLVEAIDVVSIIQAKARRALKRHAT